MIYTLVSYDGWTFADAGFAADLADADSRGQFINTPTVNTRAGATPDISQGNVSARTMAYNFSYDEASSAFADTRDAWDFLVGKLDPLNTNPRRLVGQRSNGDLVQQMAVVSTPSDFTTDEDINLSVVTFTGSPLWEATTLTTVAGVMADYGQRPSLPVPNAGYATVAPVLTITAGQTTHWDTNATVGWQHRRQIVFTNSMADAWVWPIRLNFGDTRGWDALSSGDDVRVLLDGVDLPRTLIAWNYKLTYCWIVPPPIASGETVTFDVMYGNPDAGSPQVLSGKLHPSFIYEFAVGTTTSAGTTTQLNDSTKTWDLSDINFKGGFVTMLGGANDGLTREITQQGTNNVQCAAFPSATGSGNLYLIAHSSNTRKWFNVGEWFDASAGTAVRGLWYLNSRTSQPRDIDYDVIGSWSPYPMADNTDRFAQKSYSKISSKYYAILDAYRSWQGGDPLTSEDGIADGVMFHAPLPILSLRFTATFSNNLNSECQAVVMARAGGAEDWETVYSLSDAGDSAIDEDITLPVSDSYPFLYLGLLPTDDEGLIRTDRSRDSGSTTDDGASRTIQTNSSGTGAFKVDPSSGSTTVQDSSGATVTVGHSVTVELDGRVSGSWRGVNYTDGSGNVYSGYLPLAYLNTGTTAGGNTIIDGSKNWVTNELVGATLKITGSPNKTLNGRTHTITANTATTITVGTPFPATVVQGTTYETRQAKTTVSLQSGSYLWLDFDVSGITVGTIGAEHDVYQVAEQFSVGDGGDQLFERRVSLRIGIDGVQVYIQESEQLIVDCGARRAWIQDATTLDLVRWLTDPAVLVQQVAWDQANLINVTKRAARWLPLPMGTLDDSASADDVEIASVAAGWTIAGGDLSHDSAAGTWWDPSNLAYLMDITANTGAANAHTDIILDHYFAIAPGDRVGFMVPVRVNAVALQPRLGLHWYDDTQTLISNTFADWPNLPANVWMPCSFEAIVREDGVPFHVTDVDFIAPIGAVYARLSVRIFDTVGGTVGRARVGAVSKPDHGFCVGAPKLWYGEHGGADVTVIVSFQAGYLG